MDYLWVNDVVQKCDEVRARAAAAAYWERKDCLRLLFSVEVRKKF